MNNDKFYYVHVYGRVPSMWASGWKIDYVKALKSIRAANKFIKKYKEQNIDNPFDWGYTGPFTELPEEWKRRVRW
jgi:hypothetical protein